jgi:hypothetical protein
MLTQDHSIFYADFGVDATLAGAPVRGYYRAQGREGAGAAATDPTFELPTASVPATAYGATLVVPSEGAFIVREHLPDGTGISVLTLQKG